MNARLVLIPVAAAAVAFAVWKFAPATPADGPSPTPEVEGQGDGRAQHERADRPVHHRQGDRGQLPPGHPEVREPDQVRPQAERELQAQERLQAPRPPAENRVPAGPPPHPIQPDVRTA